MYTSPMGHPMPAIADATALAAIPAAQRFNGQLLRLADGTLWRFDADSAAAAASGKVVAPGAGTGRWLRMCDVVDLGAAALATPTATGLALLEADDAAAARTALGLAEPGAASLALTAAAEDTNAIVVSGQLKDSMGEDIAEVRQVLVTVVAPTTAKGQITVASGTEKVTLNDASGKVHRSWIATTAEGAFSVSIADDQAEGVLVSAVVGGCLAASKLITFA